MINPDICHRMLVKNTVPSLAYDSALPSYQQRVRLREKFIELTGLDLIAENAKNCSQNFYIEFERDEEKYKLIRFTFDSESVDAAYNAVRNAGINLMISAGNDYNSAFQNLHGTDLALAGNPDYGIVGSPSTYPAALSVASVNENLAFGSFFKLGETKISYDESPDAALKFSTLDGDYAYVRVGGVGNANDFAKVDVKGKIALVRRGDNTFEEKAMIAEAQGAAGIIIYNNVSGEIKMNVGDAKLAVCSISQDDGEALVAAGNGKLKVELGPVENGKTYYAEMFQKTLNKNLYFNGKISPSKQIAPSFSGVAALRTHLGLSCPVKPLRS